LRDSGPANKRSPPTTLTTPSKQNRIGERRGRNIGVVAAARELITLVFCGVHDHQFRCFPARSA
jgi:hypothetical protein